MARMLLSCVLAIPVTALRVRDAAADRESQLFQVPNLTDRFAWPSVFNLMNLTRGAEVGVWQGHFSQNTLKQMPRLKEYWLVNPWRHMDDWSEPFNREDGEFERIHTNKRAMPKTLKTKGFKGKVRVLRGTSAKVCGQVEDGSLDFVYIDGDHTLKGAVTDLMLWYDKVESGGLICGDDFVDSLQHGRSYAATHVKSTVLAIAEATGVQVRGMGVGQFGFIKSTRPKPEGFAAKVLNILRSSSPDSLTKADVDAAEAAMQELKLL